MRVPGFGEDLFLREEKIHLSGQCFQDAKAINDDIAHFKDFLKALLLGPQGN